MHALRYNKTNGNLVSLPKIGQYFMNFGETTLIQAESNEKLVKNTKENDVREEYIRLVTI